MHSVLVDLTGKADGAVRFPNLMSCLTAFALLAFGAGFAQGQTIDAEYGTSISLAFGTDGAAQSVRMPGDSTGTVRVSVVEGSADSFRWHWSDEATGTELGYDQGILVEAGHPRILTITPSAPPAAEAALVIALEFLPEPYNEPDGTPETAAPLAVGETGRFRLMPRADRDVFAVTAPGNGALLAALPEVGGHSDARIRWLHADGSEVRPDWERTIRVEAGQTYYAEIRSDNGYWDEKALEDELQLVVRFTEEPYNEPDGTIETATEVTPGDVLAFRLMPRADRDFFKLLVPQNGELVLEVLEDGGHPRLTPVWFDAGTSEQIGSGWVLPVEGGRNLAFAVLSHSSYWDEQAREETVRIWLRLRRPDGSFADEELLPSEISMRPWQILRVKAGQMTPLIQIRAPQDGLYRLQMAGTSVDTAIIWTDVSSGKVLEGAEQVLSKDAELTLEVREPEAKGGREFVLELVAVDTAQAPGLYPRLPPAGAAELFQRRQQ